MEKAGYSIEYLDPNGVIDPAANGTGVLYPDGPRYRALVIDERALPAAVAERLADEAAQGLAVVLVGACRAPDTSLRGEDARVQAAVARLLAQPTVARVATQADAAGALAQLNVVPAAKWSTPDAGLHAAPRDRRRGLLLPLQRHQRPGLDRRLVRHHRPPVRAQPLDGRGRPRRRLVGERRPHDGPAAPAGARHAVLAFRKGETSPARHVASTSPVRETVSGPGNLVELRDTTGGAREVRFSDGTSNTVTLPDLPGPAAPAAWHLHVDGSSAAGTTPYDLELTELKDWRQLPQLATVVRRRHLHDHGQLPESWTARDRGTYLDLGTVAGSVKVFVNGTKIAPDSVAGRDWDVSAQLKPGANEIKVVLATPLGNAVRPAESEPYGLLGPVRLVPFGRAAVNWADGRRHRRRHGPARRSRSRSEHRASFGPFTPGVDRNYDASTAATVTCTAGDATLSVDRHHRTNATGRLVNGSFALSEPLQARAGAERVRAAEYDRGFALTLLTYDRPGQQRRRDASASVSTSRRASRCERARTARR